MPVHTHPLPPAGAAAPPQPALGEVGLQKEKEAALLPAIGSSHSAL